MPNRENETCTQMVHLGNLTLSGTTPAASDWVDLRGYDACTLVMVNNTVTDAGTASGFTATGQDNSDTTAAGAAAMGAADVRDGSTTTITVTADAADDAIAGQIAYIGGERYARLNVVGTTGTNADVSVFAILGEASVSPTTFIGTSVAAT